MIVVYKQIMFDEPVLSMFNFSEKLKLILLQDCMKLIDVIQLSFSYVENNHHHVLGDYVLLLLPLSLSKSS